ncbi:acetylornithine deacetylase [Nitratireductor rhodophyticola]|uniref:acetylornithine deacetylase n=1 Tax=Nitratireductor rhodophyticola TaxID=2854036 RepID=UPI002AC8B3A0|nr:acetylornithine deacetylase [Nitratireductor rhodophyticola]WPZ13748.1 acetylornithine deacetylase [Nitratireductor rhodophyticola]
MRSETLESTTRILSDLVGFPTISADSNLEMIAYASELLSALGARLSMTLDDSGHKANLFATLGPEGDGGIVLSGHSDVVPVEGQEWTSDPFAMREADGRLYGRGTCDMKGFIACTLAMAPHFAELDLKRPLHFAFTYDEEVGCFGARALVEELERTELRPSVAIIGEPTMMRIIEGHKGCFEYTTEFRGLAGHASSPERGVNAVEYAVRYISRLMALAEELKTRAPKGNRFDPPWTTLQVGTISGGAARNVIADHCSVEWEMRPVRNEDADFVKDRIRTFVEAELKPAMQAVFAGADIVTHVIGEVDGLEPVTESEARQIVSELTGLTEAEVVAFGTEAGLFQKAGISSVICGPGSIEQAHKADEFVSLEQLEECLGMLERLGRKVS